MDSTLLERPPSGRFPPLSDSPCYEPILEWLRRGGGVCVVTAAGRRSIDQVWNCVPPELRANRSLLLSACAGSDLVFGDANGDMITDTDYHNFAGRDGGPTCFKGATLSSLLDYSESMVRAIYKDMLEDPSILQALSLKDHKQVTAMLKQLQAGEAPETALSREYLMASGGAGEERTISLATPVLSERFDPSTLHQSEDRAAVGVCTISVRGFPRAFSDKYTLPIVQQAAEIGAHLSAAPNSLWFTPTGVNKATPVAWLHRHADDFAFDLGSAVAFGDCPHGNDEPLTRLLLESGAADPSYLVDTAVCCPFVSVANESKVHALPQHAQALHVGGLEHGTARVIRGLLNAADESERNNERPFSITRALTTVVSDEHRRNAASRLSDERRRVAAIDGLDTSSGSL